MLRAGVCVVLVAGALRAQSAPMVMMPTTDPLGLPMTRGGSGTSWLPDAAPMYSVMRDAGAWMFMLHGSAFLQQNWQGGPRGDQQFGSINWGMLNAMRRVGGGRLQLRAMMSLDPFTVGGRGYPLLQQTGEQYRGEAIHDRQHPHDLFMEAAVSYERALLSDLGVQVYVAPVGEPAVGPAAFPHRPAAAGLPLATIAHHWEDATHVSFGVATLALYTPTVKLEVSRFNGREPDDVRTNFDFRGAKLDATSGRVSINPAPSFSMQVSGAYIPDAEAAHPGEALRRGTASVLWSRELTEGRTRSVSAIIGANSEGHEAWTQSLTLEGQTDVTAKWSLFTRGEVIRQQISPVLLPVPTTANVTDRSEVARLMQVTTRLFEYPNDFSYAMQFTVGAAREVTTARFGRFALGAQAMLNRVRAADTTAYGSRTPIGAVVYLRWRTDRMKAGDGMEGMHH